MKSKSLYTCIVFGLLCLGLSACSYGSRRSFNKIPETSFLPHPLYYVGEPFDGEWRDPNHKSLEGELYIKIDTVTVAPPLANADANLVAMAEHLAHRFEKKLKHEFATIDSKYMHLVEKAPEGKTLLRIECALIDLHATGNVTNAAGDIVGIYVPGASFATSFLDKGHITFAAKVYAGDKLVAEFAECDSTPLSLLGSLNNYASYGHQRHIIDQWAHAIAEDVQKFAEGKRVHGATRFSLFSWYTSDDD